MDKSFPNGLGPICCRGSHLCRWCYLRLRKWSFAIATAELGEITTMNLAAVQARIKELEAPIRKAGIRST